LQNIVLKSLLGLKLWEKKQLARPHSRRIFMTSSCHHCLKLAGLDRVSRSTQSWMPTITSTNNE